MSRNQEARAFIERWDPDERELPDWVVDEIEADPALSALFDARFEPWEAGDLGVGKPSEPRRRRLPLGVPLGAAALALAAGLALVLTPGQEDPVAKQIFSDGTFQIDLPAANFESDRPLRLSLDGEQGQGQPPAGAFAYRSEPADPNAVASPEKTDLWNEQNQDVDGRFWYPSDPDAIAPSAQTFDGKLQNGTFNGRNPDQYIVSEDVDGLPANPDRIGILGHNLPNTGLYDLTPAQLRATIDALRSESPSGERHTDPGRHAFVRTASDPLSTFSIDVDTASYAMVRRKLSEGYLPPPAAVRPEEFVNALPYDYPRPPDGAPFGVSFEGAPGPFGTPTHLVRIGVQAKRIAADQRQSVHLTFLVDTSGSMQSEDKLGLAKYALTELTGELRDGDTVALVAYAGSAGVILPPTPMSQRERVTGALKKLTAGGSTAMGQGIDLAYRLAREAYVDGAVNRVIILSDGDANVGTTDPAALTESIRSYAEQGITLTVAGFGDGNYNDTTMEQLADDGDGNYYYIDSEREARRVFVDQLTSTLVVIARDVKLQVAWDPRSVASYRLLGYENRDIADRDFRDDRVDAGEIGAGHRVTALYELVLTPSPSSHLATVSVRNKAPGPDAPATERHYELDASALRSDLAETSREFRIAVAAASFAERLRGSPYLYGASFAQVADIARSALRPEYPEDAELLALIERARKLSGE